jgi:hypothetical protein
MHSRFIAIFVHVQHARITAHASKSNIAIVTVPQACTAHICRQYRMLTQSHTKSDICTIDSLHSTQRTASAAHVWHGWRVMTLLLFFLRVAFCLFVFACQKILKVHYKSQSTTNKITALRSV